MLAHSFLIKSSSKLLVTRTGIKAQMSLISGLWFPWPIYIFFEMRFDLGTLDSGERSLPFGLLVQVVILKVHIASKVKHLFIIYVYDTLLRQFIFVILYQLWPYCSRSMLSCIHHAPYLGYARKIFSLISQCMH